MSQAPDHKEKIEQLLKQLIEQKLISGPQAEIVLADSMVTGMAIDEVLIARRWVTEETVYALAPWLKQSSAATVAQAPPDRSSQSVATPASVSDPAVAAVPDTSHQAQTAANSERTSQPINTNFDENLRQYRELMDQILGDANK